MARPLGRSYQQNLHLTFNLMQNNMTVTLSSAGKRTFWHQIFLCQWPNWERNFYQVLSNTWDVSHYMTDPLHGSKYIIYHNVIINLSNQQELIILWWKAQTILANIRLSYPRQEILVVLYNRSDSMSLLLERVNKYKDLWVTVGRWLENEQINNPDTTSVEWITTQRFCVGLKSNNIRNSHWTIGVSSSRFCFTHSTVKNRAPWLF